MTTSSKKNNYPDDGVRNCMTVVLSRYPSKDECFASRISKTVENLPLMGSRMHPKMLKAHAKVDTWKYVDLDLKLPCPLPFPNKMLQKQ